MKTKSQLEREKLTLLNKRLKLRNQRMKWNNRLQNKAADRVFLVVLAWLVAVLGVLLLQGCLLFTKLSDNVIIALLATTTANVILLLHTVVRYLFPAPLGRSKPANKTRDAN